MSGDVPDLLPSIAGAADGRHLVTAVSGDRVCLWDLATGKPQPTWQASFARNRDTRAVFDPRGRFVAAGAGAASAHTATRRNVRLGRAAFNGERFPRPDIPDFHLRAVAQQTEIGERTRQRIAAYTCFFPDTRRRWSSSLLSTR